MSEILTPWACFVLVVGCLGVWFILSRPCQWCQSEQSAKNMKNGDKCWECGRAYEGEGEHGK